MAFLKETSQGFQGFVTLIDCFNRFVWTEGFTNKKKNELRKRFAKLFRISDTHMDVISSDGELEYM